MRKGRHPSRGGGPFVAVPYCAVFGSSSRTRGYGSVRPHELQTFTNCALPSMTLIAANTS